MKMPRMMLILSALCCAGVAAPAAPDMAQAQETIEKISLRDAVVMGVFSNPQYAAAREERLAAEEILNQSKAGYRPRIDLNAETGLEYSDRLGIDGESLWRKQASVSLTQLLYDGFGTRNRIEQSRMGLVSRTERLRETKELLGLDVVTAYLEILRQREQVTVARDNVARHRALLDTLAEAADAGTVSSGDVEQARARLAAASANLYTVLQNLSDAHAGFRRVAGFGAEELSPAGDPQIALPSAVDDMVARAVENSPRLGILAAEVRAAQAGHAAADAPFHPKFNFVVDGRKGADLDGIGGRNNNASALVVMRWNLYNGGADEARRNELGHRLNATRSRNEDTRRVIEEDVRRTWAAMKNATARAGEFAAQSRANEKVVDVYKDQFNLGRRTLLDVLDAQNELFVTRLNRINAAYTALLAKYRLLALEGGLLGFLDISHSMPPPLADSAALVVPDDTAGTDMPEEEPPESDMPQDGESTDEAAPQDG